MTHDLFTLEPSKQKIKHSLEFLFTQYYPLLMKIFLAKNSEKMIDAPNNKSINIYIFKRRKDISCDTILL